MNEVNYIDAHRGAETVLDKFDIIPEFLNRWGPLNFSPGYKIRGEVPDSDKLTLFCHGWQATKMDVMADFKQVESGMKEKGYDEGFIGFKWRSDLSWRNSNKSAVKSGEELAKFIEQISEERPELEVNLIGYSLGAKLVLEALRALEYSENIENIFLLAGAVKTSELKEDGRFFKSIKSGDFQVWSLRNPRDQILRALFFLNGAIGRKGLENNALKNFNQEVVEFGTGLNLFQKKVHVSYINKDSEALKRVVEILES